MIRPEEWRDWIRIAVETAIEVGSDYIRDVWENFIQPMAEWISDAGKDIFDAGRDFDGWLNDLFGRIVNLFDPIVLDLNSDGVQLTGLEGSNVYFDLNADGFAERTGWVSAQDGLLALDHDGNGLIDDIGDLFGSAAQDGFTMLRAYDSNSDGLISSADARFAELLVWRDANQDGVSQASELARLTNLGIASIDLSAGEVEGTIAGNEVTRADRRHRYRRNTVAESALAIGRAAAHHGVGSGG